MGDLAQFMVSNKLDENSVVDRATELSFPSSVVEYMQGALGQPAGGFPEPLRSRVLKGAPTIEGRPGASMPDFDLDGLGADLRARHGAAITKRDVLSAALYPKGARVGGGSRRAGFRNEGCASSRAPPTSTPPPTPSLRRV